MSSIIFTDVAHEGSCLTFFLRAHKLHQMHGVVVTSWYLTRFLRERHPSMFGQSSCGVGELGALDTEMRAAGDTEENSRVLLIFIARNCQLQKVNMMSIYYDCKCIYTSVDWTTLFQVMACHLFGVKPLPDPMLLFSHWNLYIDGLVQNCSISIANALEIIRIHHTLMWDEWGIKRFQTRLCRVWNHFIPHESQILIYHNQGVVDSLSGSPINTNIGVF